MLQILKFCAEDSVPRRTADILAAVEMTAELVPPDWTAPTKSARLAAKKVVLAAGPFSAGGPNRVYVAPCVIGGVVVTFFGCPDGDVSYGVRNDGRTVVVRGNGLQLLSEATLPHADALADVAALCRQEVND